MANVTDKDRIRELEAQLILWQKYALDLEERVLAEQPAPPTMNVPLECLSGTGEALAHYADKPDGWVDVNE